MVGHEARFNSDCDPLDHGGRHGIDLVETGDVLASGEGTFMAAPSDQLEILKARYRLRATGTGLDERAGIDARSTGASP